ncbi:methyltransferase [Microbacterium sediminicola]|uniref:Methyltransferase n=1 Tax=Microbacterium sediminicola TaxID=415210 RepID=A0ABN2IDV0_9MICO
MLPPLSHDVALCAALAADLDAADYRTTPVRAGWGEDADAALGAGVRTTALRALRGRSDALAVLSRLLGLGLSQPRSAVDAALPTLGARGLVALGLAHDAGEQIRPAALVRPQAWTGDDDAGEWWVASDLDEAALGGALPEDHVLGVGGASLTLAGLQIPAPAGRVLDLGCGCGIQSLRAGRSAAAIIATDVSVRALEFTRLNAVLNGLPILEAREGSLFEPVAGERFDRVFSNPPFVITPRREDVPSYEYRDGGLEGDDLVRAVITGVGEVLAPGGIAQLLGNWEYRDGEAGLDRVRAWVAEASVPMDAWIVEREILDPLAYAQLWVRDGGTAPGGDDYARLIDAWLEDFARRGVRAIGFGYVLLRRPETAEPTLARYESVTSSGNTEGLGDDLARALRVHDLVSGWSDRELSDAVFSVASDVTEARHHLPGEADPSVIELRQGRGFGRTVPVDPALAALVGACDGDLPVGVLIDAIAQLMEVEAAELRRALLPQVRELAVIGMLDPA